jgi:hypothetical protein
LAHVDVGDLAERNNSTSAAERVTEEVQED